ncbi:MAG: YARHG domain-containing protein [Rhizobiaceae bacterium]|nr:YARHG domain-containing protein [Rhizobiaceae bacterium]
MKPALLRLAAAASIVFVLAPLGAAASQRNALVIGNSSYRPGYELRNPVADARAIARSLSGLGFDVMLVQDTDLATAQRALDAFVPKALQGETSLIYYAGHGAMIDGRTFMLPVDFSMATFDQVDKEALDIERLVQTLASTHSELKLLLFDACRNNPLEDRGAEPLKQAAEVPKRAGNTLVAYATAQGRTATDGAGDHSPFAEGMMTYIVSPDMELSDLIRQVTVFVRDKTDGRQSVWTESTLERDFFIGVAAPAPGAIVEFTPPEPEAGQGLVFPDSGARLLTDAEVEGKDAATLRLARNEIFARRGMIFTDAALAAHFSQFAWYRAETAEPVLNDLELKNVELIRRYELLAAAPVEGFIFPDSDRRLLEADEVSPLGKEQLRIARNEIYARRGRKFVRAEVREYFEQFDWYDPRFGEVELTYIEQKNVDLIRRYE